MRIRKTQIPVIFFILLAVICTVTLEYIRRKPSRAVSVELPPAQKKPEQIEPEQKISTSMEEMVTAACREQNLPDDSVSRYHDHDGILHMMIATSPKIYNRLDSILTRKFRERSAAVSKIMRGQSDDKSYHLWNVEGREESMSLLFSLTPEKMPVKKKTPVSRGKSIVAIIVDDMGYSLDAIYDLCELNTPLTIAVLPFSPLAKETARIAFDNDLEVILHLPLEALNNITDNANTEGLIHSGMSPKQITTAMDESMNQVPYILGVNTHMGSKVTADRDLMQIILKKIQDRNVYFVDSRTTGRSVAYDTALEMGIPTAFRHVFLDSVVDEETIKKQLVVLLNKAKKDGEALGICHPSAVTLKVLKANMHLIAEYGLEPVFASRIVK